uniref:Kinesin-like protein n=1 Tax=Steinernema glaseri TaxID=37863 RepID=A0A1I8A2J7_9BILA
MGAEGEENVIVAVRVRPFNDREKQRNAECIVEMPDGVRTGLRNPKNPKEDTKWFSYDYSYWSHDGYEAESNGYLASKGNDYVDQKRVFDDLGQGVLENAWKGYNCSLFAYGQTGSGKSYSIVGSKGNKGLVPMVCDELFKRIDASKENDDVEYQVSIAMFEIYFEKVRDLLTTKQQPKGGLKIRENPKTGFYVEDLTEVPVRSYKEIEAKIDEGTRNRSIAATNMNATSSRAHTIVKIQFNQKTTKAGGGSTTKTSQINLVDLAGSERQKDASTQGDRLKEGIVINKSLTTLGRVIKALHEQQQTRKKGAVQVPYRDSVLTALLKNALGGNSKTIMLAAISPADVNYEETLSTLRFADRAKSIKTNAVVNESATERMIRELKEENTRLQSLIQKGGGSGASQDELEALRQQLEQNQREMENLEKTWQERLAEEQKKRGDVDHQMTEKRRLTDPHLWNLNEDPALTNVIAHFIESGENRIGNNQSDPPAQILLNGLSILPQHGLIVSKDQKKFTLKALNGAEILVNGKKMANDVDLQQNDRVFFGGNHLYVFANPKKKGVKNEKQVTYDMAQKEIAQNAGLNLLGMGGKSKEDVILEEDLINLLPNVIRANNMSKELKRGVNFELILVPPETNGNKEGLTEIWIKVHNEHEDTTFFWDKNRFTNRYYGMQEMYQNYAEGDTHWNMSSDRDPFYEPPEAEVIVGYVNVYLQSLAYMIELEDTFRIFDFQDSDMGQLSIAIVPCTVSGKDIKGDFVQEPNEMVGKNIGFKVKILAATGLPRRIEKSFCRYTFFDQPEVQTPLVAGTTAAYAHENIFLFKPARTELIEYLKEGVLSISVWGQQRSRKRQGSNAPPKVPNSLSSTPPASKAEPAKKKKSVKRASSTDKKVVRKPSTQEAPTEGAPTNGATKKVSVKKREKSVDSEKKPPKTKERDPARSKSRVRASSTKRSVDK